MSRKATPVTLVSGADNAPRRLSPPELSLVHTAWSNLVAGDTVTSLDELIELLNYMRVPLVDPVVEHCRSVFNRARHQLTRDAFLELLTQLKRIHAAWVSATAVVSNDVIDAFVACGGDDDTGGSITVDNMYALAREFELEVEGLSDLRRKPSASTWAKSYNDGLPQESGPELTFHEFCGLIGYNTFSSTQSVGDRSGSELEVATEHPGGSPVSEHEPMTLAEQASMAKAPSTAYMRNSMRGFPNNTSGTHDHVPGSVLAAMRKRSGAPMNSPFAQFASNDRLTTIMQRHRVKYAGAKQNTDAVLGEPTSRKVPEVLREFSRIVFGGSPNMKSFRRRASKMLRFTDDEGMKLWGKDQPKPRAAITSSPQDDLLVSNDWGGQSAGSFGSYRSQRSKDPVESKSAAAEYDTESSEDEIVVEDMAYDVGRKKHDPEAMGKGGSFSGRILRRGHSLLASAGNTEPTLPGPPRHRAERQARPKSPLKESSLLLPAAIMSSPRVPLPPPPAVTTRHVRSPTRRHPPPPPKQRSRFNYALTTSREEAVNTCRMDMNGVHRSEADDHLHRCYFGLHGSGGAQAAKGGTGLLEFTSVVGPVVTSERMPTEKRAVQQPAPPTRGPKAPERPRKRGVVLKEPALLDPDGVDYVVHRVARMDESLNAASTTSPRTSRR